METLTIISCAVILYNLLAISIELSIPLLNALALSSFSLFTKLNIQRPLFVVLIFEIRPSEAVLREGTLV